MGLLPRYRATWSDGVERVIHAQTLLAARELAATLEAPAGVQVLHVEPVE
jgi:hypothetical protein